MTPQDFEFVCRLVRDRSAIVLEPGKEYLVEGRLTPVARQLDLGSVAGLVGRLRAGADDRLAARVVEAMATTETRSSATSTRSSRSGRPSSRT
jgi:chemotaxis protein methyltransferase CheR